MELGAVEARNLDGGGSTTIVSHNEIVKQIANACTQRTRSAYLDTLLRWPLSSSFPPLAGNFDRVIYV